MDDLNKSFEELLLDSEEEVEIENEEPAAAVISLTDESEDEIDESNVWSSIVSSNDTPFTGISGIINNDVYLLQNPLDFYRLFVNNELVDLVVKETNRYGASKYNKYKNITDEEFWVFLMICFHMGIEHRSNLKEYWSKRLIYSTSFAAKYMSRDRFIEILNSLHFSDNATADKNNRLFKIDSILHLLNNSFYNTYSPDDIVCIDESIVLFRGRVVFRQYIR